MKDKGAMTALILIFLPMCFAITSMTINFEIIDLLYVLVVLSIIIKYYIKRRKA